MDRLKFKEDWSVYVDGFSEDEGIQGCDWYERDVDELDMVRVKEDAALRARALAALQRLCSVDYDSGTWL
ncbi:hypothetical protein JYU34_013137 [Plutella xylostella]|uniref:Uncharacterized protein n=1 Tax=Plutella xylostella TaxID=51655 RepID=A0ABQ7QDY2_PLUXY|nr:hypothetical protein JYU34_013137 [Plutella xylostella]